MVPQVVFQLLIRAALQVSSLLVPQELHHVVVPGSWIRKVDPQIICIESVATRPEDEYFPITFITAALAGIYKDISEMRTSTLCPSKDYQQAETHEPTHTTTKVQTMYEAAVKCA